MEDKKRHTYERSFGSFSRSFHLPEEVLTDKISADYEDGVLNLVIPKCEREMPKQIEVSIS